MAVNPIRRVVTLMQDMQKEIESEGEKDEKLYKKFMCYCSSNTDSLSAAGQEAAQQIEELTAKVKAEKAEKKQVAEELKQHKADRADAKQDLSKATKLREKEHKEFVAESGDTKTNLDATTSAIKALEKGAGAFLQTSAASQLKNLVTSVSNIDASDKEAVVAFLEQSGDYVPQSGQIIGILKNMKDEMDKSLGGIVSEEEEAVKGFSDLKAAKEKEIAAATSAIEAKTQRVGELAVSIVQNENAADDATKELDDSQKFLANLASTCKEKTAEWEERSKTMQEEILAISEAIAVLNDDDALDIFKASLPSPKPVTALLQKKAQRNNAITKMKELFSAKQFNSPALSLLAHTISAKLKTGVDFSSVLKMIDDMVALLKKEGQDDEKHKDWCDAEFDSSDDESKDVNRKLASLASVISEMKDEIASLTASVDTLTKEIAALDKSVAEATAQRKAEHAEFTEKVQLNESAIQLIFKAKNKLQKFYNPGQYVAPKQREMTEQERLVVAAGGDVDTSVTQQIRGTTQTVFTQLKKSSGTVDPPQAPGGEFAYKKKGQKSNSVMALMDMLSKDLEKEIAEAEHFEQTGQKEYTELVADAQESRAQNSKSISDKEASKADVEGKLQEAKTQHIVSSDQLTQVTQYIQDLHNSCDFILAHFETRRESRGQEVESLKNAKAVLSGSNYS